jgi:hypothetical protein
MNEIWRMRMTFPSLSSNDGWERRPQPWPPVEDGQRVPLCEPQH